MLTVYLSFFDSQVHQASMMAMGTDVDELLNDIRFQLELARRPGDPQLSSPPGRGSNPATAALYAAAQGNGAPVRSGYGGNGAAVQGPPSKRPPPEYVNGWPVCSVHGVGKPSRKRANSFFCDQQASREHPYWATAKGFCNWEYPEP